MKIQPAVVDSLDQLIELLAAHLDLIPGRPKILERKLQTDYGFLMLAIDEHSRLVVLLPCLSADESALVRILAARGWLNRHRHLLERLLRQKGSELAAEIRLLLIAPAVSRVMEEAVRGTSLEIELYRYRAVEVNHHPALFVDPLFETTDNQTEISQHGGTRSSSIASRQVGRVTLSAEEKRFFSSAQASP